MMTAEILKREFIYVAYYFEIQFRQIFFYWILGILIGSAVSVFAKEKIHGIFQNVAEKKFGASGLVLSSLLGIASPLCMYGTIPVASSFSQKGVKDDYLASFMMSSILLNPQLLVYSAALGKKILLIRFFSCFLCGIAAGIFVRIFFRGKNFFDFSGFSERRSHDVHPNLFVRFFLNALRNVRATGIWFLLGILLSALFQRYVPQDSFASIFAGNRGFGLLMAATVGVPLYACGGGTIPLLQQWLADGMTAGSAAAFMITGPATKITNLGAMKIVLGARNFAFYLVFVLFFALICGVAADFCAF